VEPKRKGDSILGAEGSDLLLLHLGKRRVNESGNPAGEEDEDLEMSCKGLAHSGLDREHWANGGIAGLGGGWRDSTVVAMSFLLSSSDSGLWARWRGKELRMFGNSLPRSWLDECRTGNQSAKSEFSRWVGMLQGDMRSLNDSEDPTRMALSCGLTSRLLERQERRSTKAVGYSSKSFPLSSRSEAGSRRASRSSIESMRMSKTQTLDTTAMVLVAGSSSDTVLVGGTSGESTSASQT